MIIKLEGALNARDLVGIKSKDGRSIKKGRIIRSSNLATITENDVRTLSESGLKKIVDFRTDREVKTVPDVKIDKVEYIRIPILKDMTVGITRKEDLEERELAEILVDIAIEMGEGGREWMRELYVPLVKDPYSLSKYREFLDVLSENKDGAVLYHCTCGKDRVGVGTALFMLLLDIDREEILKDYLLTNESMKADNDKAMEVARKRNVNPIIVENIPYLNGVCKEYLDKIFEIIDTSAHSKEEFFEKYLGIDKDYIEKLKDNYLE